MIYKHIAVRHNGKWHRRTVRTDFTAETVPALHKWLKQGSDAVYFAYQGEKPYPPLPPADMVLEEVTLTPEQLEKIKTSCSSCKKRTKSPETACWECAEKHLGTAYALYAREHGYQNLNRLHYLGELNNAANHLSVVPAFAEKLRTLRHDIQQDKEIPDARWEELSAEFYQLYNQHKGA